MKNLLKFELVEMDLMSLNAFKTLEEPKAEAARLELKRETSIDILEVQENHVKVRLKEGIFFKPRGPFKMDVEIQGKFRAEGLVNPEKVSPELEEAMYPMFAKASMLLALVTNEMLGTPLVIAPFREE